MTSYLQRLENTPPAGRWQLTRQWLAAEPLPFFAELHAHRPVLVLPELTLAVRHIDCVDILNRHDIFTVRHLYGSKQGDYWMAQDDTAQHWREKAIMQTVLDRETVPLIRTWVGEEAERCLARADRTMDAIAGLTRAVPIGLVQRWFGFADSDPAALQRWSYANQQDAFWNQPFDAGVAVADPAAVMTAREDANAEMRVYLQELLTRRGAELQAGAAPEDVVSRLLVLAGSGSLRFSPEAVALNVGGLLIGAVETTSHAVVNALEFLRADPARHAAARDAALADDPSAVDGFVFEALRFKPAFPYFFRTADRVTALARDTDHQTPITPGTTVLALTHAAMHDAAAVPSPATFDPGRQDKGFLFGLGLHSCLGRAIGAVMIPEIVRRALRLDELETNDPERPNDFVPEAWHWSWQ